MHSANLVSDRQPTSLVDGVLRTLAFYRQGRAA
jgi:hypothetical protein